MNRLERPPSPEKMADGAFPREKVEPLLCEQARLLELIALGHPVHSCLESLCSAVPTLDPGTRASLLVADERCLRFPRSIAPDLSPSFQKRIEDGSIDAACFGSCGEAFARDEPVTCSDIAHDDRWPDEWRELCLADGIQAAYSTPIRGADGCPLGSFTLVFDRPCTPTRWDQRIAEFGTRVASVTLQREHSDARVAAEAANRAKTTFLTTMSHELRTPLNAIIGYSDLLDAGVSGALNAGQRQHVQRIELSARHLLGLVEEILTFSRIEAGREEVRMACFDAAELARDTASLVRPLAAAKRLGLHLQVPERLEARTDPTKLRQILLNLLANAVKFTSRGEVRARVALEGTDLLLEVSDTGIGIPAGSLDQVFEPFSQLEQERSRRFEGSGLGLTVTRQLAQLLGGCIQVVSVLGQGSTFTVRVPILPRAEPEAEPETAPPTPFG